MALKALLPVNARKVSNMAASQEELERLKQRRSAAQTTFTRRANQLTSRVNAMGEDEMIGEWRSLKSEHSKFRDAGFEYATALREAEDERAEEMAEHIDAKTAECDRKFDDIEQIVLKSFWTRFAEEAITTLATEAMDQAEAADYHQMTRRQRDLKNRSLEREIADLEKEVKDWISLIPRSKVTESKECIRKLKKRCEKLWDEWAWQGDTQGWYLSGVEKEEQDEVEENQDGTFNALQGGSGPGTYNVKPLISLERPAYIIR